MRTMGFLRKFSIFSLCTLFIAAPFFASADTVLTSHAYVDGKIQAQGSASGSIFSASSPDDKAPSAKAVYTALNASTTNILTGTQDNTDTTHALTNAATTTALTAKQTKPSTAKVGQVLTYTGSTAGATVSDLNANVAASFVKIPVATGDPNAASNPGTVSSMSSIWLQ
ncbi:MAG: hypothetical protein J6T57_03315 [Alphaproteobacteria bacterium]|nr:hypothetical protein [Alphaproteobacteria bacterium]